ncbi:MAG TPA: aminotransferase class III-fold pyridoxal phosphate-dependent enzyme [Roseiflexaceae bacterium]|nr:aminotransferase class III-fold pyridoxal phosphate-dependent enzyme [Roseiflexaceae bacterium]HMP39031.1 aminotransferase class III-fold pyridoxal phosphate-dependent enzyme [Roseiflexaceae bacterium]
MIIDHYRQRHAASAAHYARATTLFPSGVTHDARYLVPFPLYIERSAGAYKWDADGNRLIDYWMGHGSLLLGHGHPAVVAAVQRQMERGTHYGAEHELALRWADLVRLLFPAVERLRFTASGTEATMMALRLARAATDRPTVIRLNGHYHGWHDMLAHDMAGEPLPPGIHTGLEEATLVLPADLAHIAEAIARRGDIAAVILEPNGASYGMIPLPDAFVRELRQITADAGVLLICDEVVTGFRITPGGVQQRAGIAADLTTFAKILAGGLPGGAVGGRAAIMRGLEFGDAAWSRRHKIRHNGTFNAAPLSAAAGIATLEQIADGEPGVVAAQHCAALISRLNALLRARGLAGWAAYGDTSIFHLVVGSRAAFAPGELPANLPFADLKYGGDTRLLQLLRLSLNIHGVDLMRGRSGFVSWAHSAADIDATVAAFAAALDDIAAE